MSQPLFYHRISKTDSICLVSLQGICKGDNEMKESLV